MPMGSRAPERMFVKSKLIPALAIRNRMPVATTRGTRATHWLGYTDKTHLRGLKNPNFLLVRLRGLSLCSSELYSPKTFKTSYDFSYEKIKNMYFETRNARNATSVVVAPECALWDFLLPSDEFLLPCRPWRLHKFLHLSFLAPVVIKGSKAL